MKGAAIIFCGVVVLIVALLIVCVEVYDHEVESRRKTIMKEGIRCKGIIQKIERKAPLEFRSAYPWRVIVRFEYADKIYTLEEQCQSKPKESVGNTVVVFVDHKDPERSYIII